MNKPRVLIRMATARPFRSEQTLAPLFLLVPGAVLLSALPLGQELTCRVRLVFNKDAEFREWLAHQADQPEVSQTENPTSPEPAHTKPSTRALFEDASHSAVIK
jgi:hypothetical protein